MHLQHAKIKKTVTCGGRKFRRGDYMQKHDKTITNSQTRLYEELIRVREAIDDLQPQIKQATSETQEIRTDILRGKDQNDVLWHNFRVFSKQQKCAISAIKSEILCLQSQENNPEIDSTIVQLENKLEEITKSIEQEKVITEQNLYQVDWGLYNLSKIHLETLKGQLKSLRRQEQKLENKLRSRKNKQVRNALLVTT